MKNKRRSYLHIPINNELRSNEGEQRDIGIKKEPKKRQWQVHIYIQAVFLDAKGQICTFYWQEALFFFLFKISKLIKIKKEISGQWMRRAIIRSYRCLFRAALVEMSFCAIYQRNFRRGSHRLWCFSFSRYSPYHGPTYQSPLAPWHGPLCVSRHRPLAPRGSAP